jgi:ribulose kinase
MAKEIKIIKEDVIPSDIPSKTLTSDCHFVTRICGQVDVVRGVGMVKIFDYYYDKGIKIKSIDVSGGQRNPKLMEPTLDK